MALADPLIDTATFATYLRTTFATDEAAQADLILRVVSAWVRTVGNKNWNASTLLAPDDVVGVVLSAARREWENPDRYITETMGPLSVTRAAPPLGFFSPGELQILRKKTSALFTIGTRREEWGWGVGYLHMNQQLSDEPFPYLNYGDPGYNETIHLGP